MAVQLCNEDLAIGNGDAAGLLAAAQIGIAQFGRIGPKLLARDRVVGLNVVVAHLDIKHAIHFDDGGFHRLGDAGLDYRGGPQLPDVPGIDLGEGRETLIVIGAPVQQPIFRPVGAQHHLVGDVDILRHWLHPEGAGMGNNLAQRHGIEPGGLCRRTGRGGIDRAGGFTGAFNGYAGRRSGAICFLFRCLADRAAGQRCTQRERRQSPCSHRPPPLPLCAFVFSSSVT